MNGVACIFGRIMFVQALFLSNKLLDMKTNVLLIGLMMASASPLFSQQPCSGSSNEFYLNSNNIRASFFPDGNKFTSGNGAGFLVPYPSKQRLGTMFASAPWIAGFTDAGNFKLAAETYPTYQDFDYSVGPLNPIGIPYDSICEHYDFAWSVYYEDIITHIRDFELDFKVDDTLPAIFGWPARGNKHFESYYGFELPLDNQGLAPFHDWNGNNIYDPENGDYPVVRFSTGGSEYIPDQILWMVFNDVDEGDTTDGGPLLFEIHLTAFAFHCEDNPILNNTIFNSYKIINRAVLALDSAFFGTWTDYDLGCSVDDFVGSDSIRSTEFVYNADPIDGDLSVDCSTGADTYATRPPVQSMTYLSHPMHSFITTSAFAATPAEMYRLLNGEFEDGTPITPEGDGYNPGSILPATKFLFNGDPRDTSDWSGIKNLPDGRDQKTVSSIYLGRMNPGTVRNIHMAYMVHYDSAGGHLDQITAMYRNIDSLPSILFASDQPCTPFPICEDNDCVWPGDFDHNGIVDHRDYLTWGVHNGKTGFQRNGLISWRGHFGEDWTGALDGINAKHSDGDGNGEVNLDDIDVHGQNQLLINPDYEPDALYPLGDDLVITARPIDDQGRIRSVTIKAGHALHDVLGISFEVEFDTSIFSRLNAFTFWPESDTRLLFQQYYNPNELIYYAAVQTNNSAIAIENEFAFVRMPGSGFTVKNGLPIPDSTIIRLRNLKGIDAEGNDLHLGSRQLVVYREGFVSTSNPEPNPQILVVPNPASDWIRIHSDVIGDAVLYTTLGQPVSFLSPTQLEQPIDVSHLHPGLYFLSVEGHGEMVKIVKR
jgi:hypothetical protein